MGSLAAHRGDRAEATGLFHPFSHSVPLPTITYSILLNHAHTLCVSLDANLSLSLPLSSLSYIYFFVLSPASFLFIFFQRRLKPSSLSFFSSTLFPVSHTAFPHPLFSPLIFHFLCPVLPMWVHWIVMWGAAVLLTKHKAFHIHPAPGIPGYAECVCMCLRACVCARACMWEKQWEWNKRKKPQPSRMLYNSLMLSCTKPNWNPRCPGPERAPIATRIYGNTTSFIKVFSLPSARL